MACESWWEGEVLGRRGQGKTSEISSTLQCDVKTATILQIKDKIQKERQDNLGVFKLQDQKGEAIMNRYRSLRKN